MVTVASQIVRYEVDESIVAGFEFEPGPGWHPAGAVELAGKVRDAVSPAIAVAKVVLERIREIGAGGVEVKFGVRVNGEANWIVAKAGAEGNFEVTLTWNSDAG